MKRSYIILLAIVLFVVIVVISLRQSCRPEDLIHILETEANIKIIVGERLSDKNTIVLKDKKFICNWLTPNDLGISESYIKNEWNALDLENVLYKMLLKDDTIYKRITQKYWRYLLSSYAASPFKRLAKKNNGIENSKENITFHYDIGNDLYKKMLGYTMQYTCAAGYYDGMTLDEAQSNKMRIIGHKLQLKKGMTVLDIGCGFGSLANYLQETYDVKVTGVTLSKNQYEYATSNFKNATFLLKDYRKVSGTFDRVYSIGMFEHVGRKSYQEYFDTCYKLLKDDGIMLIHTCGTKTRKWPTERFINKYIFPGGEVPHLSHMVAEDKWTMEHFENFGHSYAKTLRAWYRNVTKDNWGGLSPEKYDERFKRIWTFYLLGCAAAFRSTNTLLWQIVYRKRRTSENYVHKRIY